MIFKMFRVFSLFSRGGGKAHWDSYLNEDKTNLKFLVFQQNLLCSFFEMGRPAIRYMKTMFQLEGLLERKGSFNGETWKRL